MEKCPLIRALQANAPVEGIYTLKEAALRAAPNGSAYLSAVLSDDSGTINAVAWNYTGSVGAGEQGKAVKIKGRVAEYRGKLQIVVSEIGVSPATEAPASQMQNAPQQPRPAAPAKAGSHGKPVGEIKVNERVTGFYLLQNAAVRSGSNGKSFLSGTLMDRTGSIPIKVWDYSGPLGSADEGKVVKIRGLSSDYRGEVQLVVEEIRLAQPSDSFDLEELIPAAPIDVEQAYGEIVKTVDSLTDPDYQAICRAMLERHAAQLRQIPAAKSVHHSFLHGLLMHTGNMLKIAENLAGMYPEVVDRDLLLAGTMLHDFAKSAEFLFSELGLVTDYSVKGKLLGHLVMGAQEIACAAAELQVPEEKSVLLQHLILSHHGKPEYGAAVSPQCAESELLSLIDLIDSRMEIYREKFEEVNVGEFSAAVFALENKKLYRHKDLTPPKGTE